MPKKIDTPVSEQPESDNNNTNNYVKALGKCVITNYYGGDELGSGTKGCMGTELTPNYSCASHNIPCGTKVYIPALKGAVNSTGIFNVEDTGGFINKASLHGNM